MTNFVIRTEFGGGHFAMRNRSTAVEALQAIIKARADGALVIEATDGYGTPYTDAQLSELAEAEINKSYAIKEP